MKTKRMIAMFLVVITLISIAAIPANAYEEPTHYKGFDISYGGGLFWGTYTWRSGLLWLDKNTETYYLVSDYYRCWDYYTDGWVANNGQTMSLTTSVTHEALIGSTVSSEIGASARGIDVKVDASMTDSVSVAYSSSLGLSYDLKNYDVSSVRIAAMGYISKFKIEHRRNGELNGNPTYVYAFDNDWGYEITLVYRY